MAFYFQPPLFAARPQTIPTIVIAPVVPLPTIRPPFLNTISLPTLQYCNSPTVFLYSTTTAPSQIKFKVIFHGTQDPDHAPPAPFYLSIDASYDLAPSRELVLADMSLWASNHGLGDRVGADQATLYLTRSVACPLVVAPPPPPTGGRSRFAPAAGEVVRAVALGERVLGREFEGLMEETRGGRHGAFLMVDVDAREVDQQHSQRDNESVGTRQEEENPPGSDVQHEEESHE